MAREGIHQWSGKRREIALTHGASGNKKKERRGKAPAIGFEVRKKESPGFAVGELRKGERAAQAAAERVVGLVRLVHRVPDFGVECIVLQILERAAVELIAATFGGDGDIPDLREFG